MKRKTTYDSIVNIGNKKIEVIGPLLEDEGIKLFLENKLIRKIDKHKKLFSK